MVFKQHTISYRCLAPHATPILVIHLTIFSHSQGYLNGEICMQVLIYHIKLDRIVDLKVVVTNILVIIIVLCFHHPNDFLLYLQ